VHKSRRIYVKGDANMWKVTYKKCPLFHWQKPRKIFSCIHFVHFVVHMLQETWKCQNKPVKDNSSHLAKVSQNFVAYQFRSKYVGRHGNMWKETYKSDLFSNGKSLTPFRGKQRTGCGVNIYIYIYIYEKRSERFKRDVEMQKEMLKCKKRH